MQVDPIKPKLQPSRTKRLKLKYDEPLSNVAFKFSLRRYNLAAVIDARASELGRRYTGRGLHSSTSQLNLSRV